MGSRCSHRRHVAIRDLPEQILGCEDCLATGGWWLHLQMCMSCGHIRCCDSSPNQHARRHAGELGHPIIRSAELGEGCAWCYVDALDFSALDGP
jgi:ubiquitin-hydrolase Zn-finger-containing protein